MYISDVSRAVAGQTKLNVRRKTKQVYYARHSIACLITERCTFSITFSSFINCGFFTNYRLRLVKCITCCCCCCVSLWMYECIFFVSAYVSECEWTRVCVCLCVLVYCVCVCLCLYVGVSSLMHKQHFPSGNMLNRFESQCTQ